MFGAKKKTNGTLNKINSGKGKNIAIGAIVVVLLLLLVSESYYSIQEEEQAVVCTFGSPKAVTGTAFQNPVYPDGDEGQYDDSGIFHRVPRHRRGGGCPDDYLRL